MDYEEVLRVLRAFQDAGVEYVMIGATAMGIHGLVRGTEDVDLLVRAAKANVRRLRTALREAYPGDRSIDEIRDADLLGDYAVVRYHPPHGGYYFDFIARLGETATFESVESEMKQIKGVQVSVATPSALYRLKKDTIRAIDRRDAAALRDQFRLEDVD